MKYNRNINRIIDNLRLYKEWYKKSIKSLTVPFKIDVHAVEHCNLNCKGCSHFSPLAKPKYLDPEEFEKNVKQLSKLKSSLQAFQILGGEPLLHPRLSEIMEISRRWLNGTRITLLTNGILLLDEDKLPPKFWESCKTNDIIIKITKYPGAADYDAVVRKINEKGIKFEIFKDRSLTLSWGKYQLHENDVRRKWDRSRLFKFKYCESVNCLQLAGDRIFPCALSAYVSHLNSTYHKNFKITKKDYIEIKDLKHKRQLRKLMLLAIPFCKYCGKKPEQDCWARSNYDPKEWIDFKSDIKK